MATLGPTIVPQEDSVNAAANALATAANADVFFYNSKIYRQCDDKIIAACAKRNKRPNVILFLVTEGGDPDAAYRIARCFQSYYEKFTCVVSGYCKSGGTMIVIGAHELVVADSGELGPLDIQMGKKDELWETESGLTVMAALGALHEKAFSAFEHFCLTVKRKSGNRVTFKTAAEYAVKLSVGLFAPIFQQIDPVHVGEASRAQAIAQSYGVRLALYSKNISEESLDQLVGGYPSHGFVIDRAEAEGLFENVREPNQAERDLIEALGKAAIDPLPKEYALRRFMSEEGGHNVRANIAAASRTEHEAVAAPANTGEGAERQGVAGRTAAAS